MFSLSLALVHLASLASPGPDFLLVTQIAIARSKVLGIFLSLGIVLANAVHVIISVIILEAASSFSHILLKTIQLLGCLYLFWMGVGMLRGLVSAGELKGGKSINVETSNGRAFTSGFLTSIGNPKAFVYFSSVMPQFIKTTNGFVVNLFLFLQVISISFLWFLFLNYVFSTKLARSSYLAKWKLIDAFVALLFIGFSVIFIFQILGRPV